MQTVPEAERATRFTRLAHDLGEPLRRSVVRRAPAAVVDDVVADTLLVLWRRLDDVPDDDPLPWAYTVARRCLANGGEVVACGFSGPYTDEMAAAYDEAFGG